MTIVFNATTGISTPPVSVLGDTSGSITFVAPAVAGSNTQTLVAATGTLAPLIAGTAVTASGASVDFTDIPSWAKRITVIINGISPSTGVIPQVQLGSGSLQTTGYVAGAGYYLGGPATGSASSTTGFPIRAAGGAADIHYGIMTLVLLGSNTWVSSWIGYMSNNTTQETGAGSVTLSGTLDRLSLVVSSTFDAGSVNILYE
jgi:hypothetical protein